MRKWIWSLTSIFGITLKRKSVVSTTIIIATLKKKTITFPWIPKIGPKIKKESQKFRCRVTFRVELNLSNILCKNNDKLIPYSHPGVYKLKSSCGSVYNSETKKKIISRLIDCRLSICYTPKLSQSNISTMIEYKEMVRCRKDKMLNRDNGNFVKILLPFKKLYVICFIESPLKMIKNVFYFIFKPVFVLKIFTFFSWLFGHLEKTAPLER